MAPKMDPNNVLLTTMKHLYNNIQDANYGHISLTCLYNEQVFIVPLVSGVCSYYQMIY